MFPLFKGVIYIVASIIVFIQPSYSAVVQLSCKQYGNFSISKRGNVLSGHVMKRLPYLTEKECKIECILTYGCKSVNYETVSHNHCEVNNKTTEDASDNVTLTKKSGWTFFTTDYFEPLLGDNCKKAKPCPAGVLCKDTCTCPGYQCYPCHNGRAGLHCEVWRDCWAAVSNNNNKNGVYVIQPTRIHRYKVFCERLELNTWLVIQRRTQPTTEFKKGWEAYKNGFGDLSGDFWIGLEKLHNMTGLGNPARLYVAFETLEGTKNVQVYKKFAVGPESDGYKLKVEEHVRSSENLFEFHNNMKFSTLDRDNDFDDGNCALKYGGGWWYKGGIGVACQSVNFNGFSHLTIENAIKSSKMMIRWKIR